MGEGEFPLLKLCDALIRKTATDLSQIKGLCYRSPNGMHSSSPERIQDLSLLPISDRSLFSNNYYTRMEFLEGSGDFIITSRGCPAACNFCAASKMFPGGVRYRNMDHVASEIEYLQSRQKLSGLKIFDSTFTASRDHVEAFCKMVKPFKMKWECEIRADTVDYNLLRLMNDAGCYYINMGMETTNTEHLKKIAKGITPRQVLSVLDMCTDIGIFTKVFFTFGHINQTFKECLDDIRFIEDNKARIHFFAITVGMRIYPGTRLEKTCKEIKQYPRSFSYTKPYHSLKKLLVGEPSDVPILFQKKLNAHHMFFIICFLLLKGLYCTKAFLIAMAFSNVGIFIKSLYIRYCYTVHRSRRIRDFILKKGMYITE
jgi:radical SAM superfamily enzyme YgiQ (UPF0313 family)